mgnify:CR=1 FL=1
MSTVTVSKDVLEELIKNNITLQKVSIQLVDGVKKMTERTDRLLALFEEAAKNIERSEMSEPLSKKLEALLEQNKIIARGLVLIEKFIREKTSVGFSREEYEPRKLPRI